MFSLSKNSGLVKAKIKMFTGIFTVIFAVVGFLGISFCTGMNSLSTMTEHTTDSHAHAQSDCDSSVSTDQCGMSIFEHLSQWESKFLATLDEGMFELLVFSFLTLTYFCLRFLNYKYSFEKPKEIIFYIRSHPEFSLYKKFLSLFSEGILHPKILT